MYRLLTDSPVAKVGRRVGGRSLIRGDGFGATTVTLFWASSELLLFPSRRAGVVVASLGGCGIGVVELGALGGGFLTAAANRECAGS